MIGEYNLQILVTPDIQQKVLLLVNSGVLSTNNGQVVLHFDNDGNLRKIEQNKTLYKA